MSDPRGTGTRRPGGLVGKRHAILTGALAAFARDGYTRASIDAISSAAGVSTRTIYNHFTDKEELFQTVIRESSAQVAEAQVELIEQHLTRVEDLEEALVAFGRAWATPHVEYADHYALVRQINAEIGHIPQATIDTWQRTGPQRVQRELAYHMRKLADRGLLRVEDADRSALHLSVLVSAHNPSYAGAGLGPDEVEAMVRAGVRTFLHGHAT